MRLLVFHADSLQFEVTDTADAEVSRSEGVLDGGFEECLVVFLTVEAGDEADLDAAVTNARREVVDVAAQLRTDRIVLYPSATLSDTAADSDVAERALAALADTLGEEFAVLQAPVTADSAFELAAKGHPFAEQSRRVTARRETAPDEESRPERVVVFPDGTRRALGDVESDLTEGTGREAGAELAALRDEPGDDTPRPETVGAEANLVASAGEQTRRLTPRGTFLRDAIVEWVREQALSAGAVPVETAAPADAAAFDGSEPVASTGVGGATVRPAVRSMLSEMRFGADGQRRVYQRGQQSSVAGVGEDRWAGQQFAAGTTPELWTLAADLAAAQDAVQRDAALLGRLASGLGVETVGLLQVTAAFDDDHGPWIETLVGALAEPVVLERRPEHRQSDPAVLTFLAADGQPVALGSIRLHGERTGQFGVGEGTAVEDDGQGGGVLLCCRPVRTAEGAVLTVAAQAARREPPQLPTWLAPTQVRLVPTDPKEYRETCEEYATALATAGVRVDIDDRSLPVGERLDHADTDWVPYDVVIGSDQATGVNSGPDTAGGELLPVHVRAARTETELSVAALGERILDETGGYPQKRQYLPRSLRRQPSVSRE